MLDIQREVIYVSFAIWISLIINSELRKRRLYCYFVGSGSWFMADRD